MVRSTRTSGEDIQQLKVKIKTGTNIQKRALNVSLAAGEFRVAGVVVTCECRRRSSSEYNKSGCRDHDERWKRLEGAWRSPAEVLQAENGRKTVNAEQDGE